MRHLNYDKIDDYIYIGTSICCKQHFKKLLQIGIIADIDLEQEKMDHPSGVKSFLWLPTYDFMAPSQAQLYIGAHFMYNLVTHKMKCYVHCNAGHGRAPTLVAAYYLLRGFTIKNALIKIKKRRPGIKPNVRQVHALKLFQKHVSVI